MRQDRPYQTETVEAIRATVRSGISRIAVQGPTGSGKTLMAARIGEGAQRKGNRISFVVPAVALVDQVVEEFYSNGIRDIGVIQADHHMTDWTRPVQVCSIQTIEARQAFPPSAVVMFDECHRLYKIHKKWLSDPAFAKVPFIGWSATPWARGLGNHFQTLIVSATISDLIEQGYLSKFKAFATSHPDLKNVKTVAGDYHEGQLSGVMQESGLAADIIRTYREKWGKGKTLCFAVDRAHAQSLQERFTFAGVPCGYQDGDTPADERVALKRAFHNGEIEVAVSVGTLTTGVDWDVRCLILARPTKSEMLYVQIIGRALRPAPGKEEAIILDHSDTTGRLGFVTDIHHDGLNNGKVTPGAVTKRKEKLPVACKMCAVLHPPNRERKCPNCGHVNRLQSSLIEDDGELVEVKRNGSMFMAAKVAAREWTLGERITFLSELKAYAAMHGYKPGWAAMKFKEKFKGWPEEFGIRNQAAVPVAQILSPTVALWIRSRMIAYAKMRQRDAMREAAE